MEVAILVVATTLSFFATFSMVFDPSETPSDVTPWQAGVYWLATALGWIIWWFELSNWFYIVPGMILVVYVLARSLSKFRLPLA